MVRACLPELAEESMNMLFGDEGDFETTDGTTNDGTASGPATRARSVLLEMVDDPARGGSVARDIPGRRANIQAPRPGV